MDDSNLMLDEETGVVLPHPETEEPIQLDAEPVPREADLFEESVLMAPSAGVLFDSETVIEAAFQYYREKGFPYPWQPLHVSMQELNTLARTDTDSLLRTPTGNQIANSYHPHRLHSTVKGKKSPFESFHIDKNLRHAIKLVYEMKGEIDEGYQSQFSLVYGTQACSNFRPGFALWMYRRFAPVDGVVLDTSTGYGGRLVGFLASTCSKYLGFDPNTLTYEGNCRMVKELRQRSRVELHCLPAEDVDRDEFLETCDFAFTSPPYFTKEHYSEEDTQSWKRYPEFQSWCDGFLSPMLRLQFAALRPGCRSIVNIADVNIGTQRYPLVDETIARGQAVGFDFERQESFQLGVRFGKNQDEEIAVEPVLIFRKPG